MSAPVLLSKQEKVQKEFQALVKLYQVPTHRIKPYLEFRSRMRKGITGLFYTNLDLTVIKKGQTLQESIRSMKHEFAHFLQKYFGLPYSHKQADAFGIGLNPLDVIPLRNWDEVKIMTFTQTDLDGYSIGISWDVIV